MDILLINAISYTIVFLYFLYKYKRLNVFNAVLLAFAVIAIFGYITTKMGIQLVGSVHFGEKTSIIPYICLLLSVLLITSPLKTLDNFSVPYSEMNSVYFKRFVNISVLVYLLVNITMLAKVYLVLQQGLAEAYLSRRLDGEELVKFDNAILDFFATKGMTYVTATFPVIVIYFFYNIIRKKKQFKSSLCILMCFIPSILSSLCAGSKGMLFFNAFDIIFFYLIFEKNLSVKTKRIFVGVGFGVAFALITYAIAIQNDRLSTSNSDKVASEVMMRYLGECMPNLGDLYVDTKVHPYGKRFFPYIFDGKIFNTAELRNTYWANYTHARIDNFKTIWGDAYVEFGILGAFVFLFLVFFLYKKYVFSRNKHLYVFPLIYIYYNKVCIYGIFDVCFVDARSLQVTLYAILLSFFLYKIQKNKNVAQEISSLNTK